MAGAARVPPIGDVLDPVWGHLSAPWHTLKPREQGAEQVILAGLELGWAWDPTGSAPAAKALQPDTSRGKRENTPKLPREGEEPNPCLRK